MTKAPLDHQSLLRYSAIPSALLTPITVASAPVVLATIRYRFPMALVSSNTSETVWCRMPAAHGPMPRTTKHQACSTRGRLHQLPSTVQMRRECPLPDARLESQSLQLLRPPAHRLATRHVVSHMATGTSSRRSRVPPKPAPPRHCVITAALRAAQSSTQQRQLSCTNLSVNHTQLRSTLAPSLGRRQWMLTIRAVLEARHRDSKVKTRLLPCGLDSKAATTTSLIRCCLTSDGPAQVLTGFA